MGDERVLYVFVKEERQARGSHIGPNPLNVLGDEDIDSQRITVLHIYICNSVGI